MPAHFTHLLFAEEALRAALGDKAQSILGAHGNIFRFGAQGPDFFYHNQRTMPTGLRYGVALHRRGFGSLVEQMTREALRLGVGPAPSYPRTSWVSSPMALWTDPRTLTSAISPAGWIRGMRTRSDTSTPIPSWNGSLDVMVLQSRFGRSLDDFDFLSLVRCGKMLPYPVVKALVKGLNAIYPSYNYKSRDRLRVQNAYHDTIFFYKLTNHLNPDIARLAYRKDRKEGFTQRRIALLHPRDIPPEHDFLNLHHATWCHPCDSATVSTASFIDLYEEALGVSIHLLQETYRVLSGQASPEGLAQLVGDQNLDTRAGKLPA